MHLSDWILLNCFKDLRDAIIVLHDAGHRLSDAIIVLLMVETSYKLPEAIQTVLVHMLASLTG